MAAPIVRLPARALTAAGVCAIAGLCLMVTGVLPIPVWPLAPHPARRDTSIDERAREAERLMREAARFIYAAKQRDGVFLDHGGDPEAIAFVGSELTPLMSTLGSLEVKRLASSPAWARRLTSELAGAGVSGGSVIAANFSGSFPGINLAVICAARALGARLVAVSSVTASTWGATDPGFTWPEIEARLVEARLIPAASAGVSVGGDGDRGLDLESGGRDLAESIAASSALRLGAEVIRAASLDDAVLERVRIITHRAGGGAIVVFVNVGGTSASMGSDEAILRLRTGWLPPDSTRASGNGLVSYFAVRGIPVLHMLNIRDLAAQWGITH